MNSQKLTYRQFLGNQGENQAVKLLAEKGYNMLKRNYRVHNVGEIDIIAEKDNDIHIIEVRARLNLGSYPDSVESVAGAKMNKVIRTAEHFVMENRLYDKNVVFEICMVTHDKQGNIQRIDFVPF